VAAAEVLHKGMAGGDSRRRWEAFESAHRPQPGLQPSMIGFDAGIAVLLGDVRCRWDQFVQHPQVRTGLVRGHLDRRRTATQSPEEEPAGGRGIPLLGQQDIDDLPVLVNRPVQVPPPASDLHVGLIDPPIASHVPGAGGPYAATSAAVSAATRSATATSAASTSWPASATSTTYVTTMLNAGVDLRDVQIAARHADPRTTMRYDRARNHLDRHPNYISPPTSPPAPNPRDGRDINRSHDLADVRSFLSHSALDPRRTARNCRTSGSCSRP
jgi:hypothetical protein